MAVSGSIYCVKHCKDRQRQLDLQRGTRTERGYSNRWLRAAKLFLAEYPLCAECERQGRVCAATLVDHIIPHRGDRDLFWDQANWQPLCASCHGVKTAGEDGGFGNRIRGGVG
ncbi:HNH endonuclease [Chitiniphilus eburneus]|uniref:HNH endonuclease n=1 Tax=Chitiniphilus eburneus TaxID=2571148 RepID=UPI0035CE926B